MGKMLEDVTKIGKTRMGTLEERAEHALHIARRAMGPLHGENEDAPPRSKERAAYARQEAAPPARQETAPPKESGEVSADETIDRLTNVVSTLSTVAKGVGLALMVVRTGSTIVRLVRTVSPGPLIGGRRSSLGTVALIGAGTLVGAGAAAAIIASTEGDMNLAQRFEIAKQKAMFGMDRLASSLFGSRGGKKAVANK